MTTTPEQGQRKPGRPRSAQAHKAILVATLEALAEEGYQAMSIEGVAARAGVGKTTIYRRWTSKEDLVIDAIHEIQTEFPISDSGNFREDLISFCLQAYQAFSANPLIEKLVFKIIGEVKTNPQIVQAIQSRLMTPRMQRFSNLVKHAQARGEIRADLDPVVVVDLIGGALFFCLLFSSTLSGAPTPTSIVEQVIDAAMQGIGTR
ncbi:MAG: TetR/AcrR family transcriptional regulator [Chloroflexota bacterium]|nr:TetR/AcrR family transcriptional regulator [Chloroflexota bacterium]